MKKNLLAMMAILAMGMVGCSQASGTEVPVKDVAVGDLFSGAPSPELGRTSGTQITGQGKTIWTGLCSVADF